MWPLSGSAAVEETATKAMISIDVPADYKWVLLALVGVFFANQYLVIGVMKARKKYGIKYPALFAPVSALESELRRRRHHVAAPPRRRRRAQVRTARPQE